MAGHGPANGGLPALVHQLAQLLAADFAVGRVEIALALEAMVGVAAGVEAALGGSKLFFRLAADAVASVRRLAFQELNPRLFEEFDEFSWRQCFFIGASHNAPPEVDGTLNQNHALRTIPHDTE